MDNISVLYEKFDDDQKIEIQNGINAGLDVSVYAIPEYLAIQMRQIRLGMEEGLDVSVYNKREYDWFQMEEIRLGMKSNVSYKIYAKPSVDYRKMRQIRKGLEDGMDLSPFIKFEAGILEELRKSVLAKVSIADYIKEGYDVEQLMEIRNALEKKLNLRPYISTKYRGASIREICLGLEAGVPVDKYATLDYGWQQMREIRLGMEARVDISKYSNSLFSWQQMREIRLGLEEGLDIDQYRKFIYTASDMERIRRKLLLAETSEIVDTVVEHTVSDEYIKIFISTDEMEACIQVSDEVEITKKDIMKKLRQYGIVQGILTDEVKSIIEKKRYKKTIVVARGQYPKAGKDGWYELFFDANPNRIPQIMADGSVNFKDIKWFELVRENQKLVYYHEAEFGESGFTVTGKFLKAKKGHEKSVLRGQGFRLEEDGKTYISEMDGKVVFDGKNRLDVSRVCILDEVNFATGNIRFDGTVYIKGNVGSGVTIYATENVVVEGYVEAAIIKSDSDIFLRNGANGNGSGLIEAKGNVVGQFFEEIKVVAGGDITGQYCMNCMLFSENKIILVGNKGLLLGGMSRAAKGISAYCIGNKRGLRTVLNVGIDHESLKQLQRINMEIENVNRELAILNHSRADFQRKYSPEIRNTMDIYLKIENAIYTKDLQLKQLLEDTHEMEAKIVEMKGAKIDVAGILYDGTEVTIDNIKWNAFSVRGITMRCVNDKIVMES